MTEEQYVMNDAPDAPPKNTKTRMNVNTLTILLVFVFLLVLVAESVAASSMLFPPAGGEGAAFGKTNLTREYETCVAEKSEAKCNKTATAYARKSPTPKSCDPYKSGRAAKAGETFDQYVAYYRMDNEQRDSFIKINGLSPAYPNTVIYTGVKYCLPNSINVRLVEGTDKPEGYNPYADFGFEVIDINGYEISFNLINLQKNDKINVYFWKRPPGASGWHCQESIDGNCVDVSYREREVFSDGYSENRKIWLGQFKVQSSPITLIFPSEVAGWNNIYVCFHSLYRSEDDESHDKDQHVASYHSYCQYINLNNRITTMITRMPAATQTGRPMTATAANTPCGYVYDPMERPPAGFWAGICPGGTPETGYVCMPPCPGKRKPTPTSTPCGTAYGKSCPGTRIPWPTLAVGGCQFDYHLDPIYTPTYLPGSTPCNNWWLTPEAYR